MPLLPRRIPWSVVASVLTCSNEGIHHFPSVVGSGAVVATRRRRWWSTAGFPPRRHRDGISATVTAWAEPSLLAVDGMDCRRRGCRQPPALRHRGCRSLLALSRPASSSSGPRATMELLVV